MENKNAFKHWINEDVAFNIAESIQIHYPQFDSKSFLKLAPKLKNLELKARVLEITQGLKKHLPMDYPVATKLLIKVIKNSNLKGFNLWPFSEYFSQFGTDHFEVSLQAMLPLTEKFTSEFAIRPFLLKNPSTVFGFLEQHVNHPSAHVRRWISEGTRPYLPWGAKVLQIAENPEWTLKLLEKLKYDDELYVRKSIANHLNDHSKKHPKLVIETLKRWQNEATKKHFEKIEWIKRHALRTLIKKGDAGALKLMGVDRRIDIEVGKIKLNKKFFKLGEKLDFEFEIQSSSNKPQKLIVDYGIDFMKSNGKLKTKIYKLKTLKLLPKEKIKIKKVHSLKKITTMRFYSGKHQLKIQINGKFFDDVTWFLKT